MWSEKKDEYGNRLLCNLILISHVPTGDSFVFDCGPESPDDFGPNQELASCLVSCGNCMRGLEINPQECLYELMTDGVIRHHNLHSVERSFTYEEAAQFVKDAYPDCEYMRL